jgi:hypothetical protein
VDEGEALASGGIGEVFDIDDMAASMQSGSDRHLDDNPAEFGKTVSCAARHQAGRTQVDIT